MIRRSRKLMESVGNVLVDDSGVDQVISFDILENS